MNYNPQEQQSLASLLVALRGGLDPNTAYTQLQNVIGQQQQRVADRQQQLGSLTDLLTQGAAQGQTFQQSQMLADLQTPGQGTPPMIANALSTLYPQPQRTNMYGGPAPQQAPPQQVISPLY